MRGEIPAAETPEQLYARVFQELKPRTSAPPIEVSFRRFAHVNSFIEYKEGKLRVRISDLLAAAPKSVQEALAWILLCKLNRREIPPRHLDRYRRYLNRRDMVRSVEQLRKSRGRKTILPAQGRRYDLIGMFEDLNFRFFHGLMSRPDVGWSRSPSRTILGHYDTAHHAIVISRLLDQEDVPAYVVEYVMYHEMLHLKHPVERRGGRRCVHPAEFRREEEAFPYFQEAKHWFETGLRRLK